MVTDLRQRGEIIPEISFALIQDEGADDQRRFGRQETNEVAIVFRAPHGVADKPPHIVVHTMDDRECKLPEESPLADPAVFVLLFSAGGQGWRPGIPHVNRQPRTERERNNRQQETNHNSLAYGQVTLAQFNAYNFQYRDGFNIFVDAGPLSQLYIAHALIRKERRELLFHRKNQETLRCGTQNELLNFVRNHTGDSRIQMGHYYKLPSTYPGSPRNQAQNCLDAMQLMFRYGKPCLFTTFTCNPKWDEITSVIGENTPSEYHPVLVARVFQAKLKEMIADIESGRVFGRVVATTYVVEWQKRGLPHAHILIFLSDQNKIRTADDIDRIVWAELPNKDELPELYDVIVKNNIHGVYHSPIMRFDLIKSRC
jgi:hypothetical protein